MGKTWNAKIKPKESIFSIKLPNRKIEPCLVNPKMVTKTELIHSNPSCIKGTLKIKTANKNCINKPLTTNLQSIAPLFLEKIKEINTKTKIQVYLSKHSKKSNLILNIDYYFLKM